MKFNYDLPLAFGAVNGPEYLPEREIEQCTSYRQAVRLCWLHRRSKAMTQAMLAMLALLTPQHVSDYLAADDEPHRRDLPASKIEAFETVCGNRAISQWEARQRGFTIMEEILQRRKSA